MKSPVSWSEPRDEEWFWAFAKAIGVDSGLMCPIKPEGVAESIRMIQSDARRAAIEEAAHAVLMPVEYPIGSVWIGRASERRALADKIRALAEKDKACPE